MFDVGVFAYLDVHLFPSRFSGAIPVASLNRSNQVSELARLRIQPKSERQFCKLIFERALSRKNRNCLRQNLPGLQHVHIEKVVIR